MFRKTNISNPLIRTCTKWMTPNELRDIAFVGTFMRYTAVEGTHIRTHNKV